MAVVLDVVKCNTLALFPQDDEEAEVELDDDEEDVDDDEGCESEREDGGSTKLVLSPLSSRSEKAVLCSRLSVGDEGVDVNNVEPAMAIRVGGVDENGNGVGRRGSGVK